jgi:hypothetical protein
MKQIFEVYSSEYDITTIFEDTYENGEIVSTEVVGFYFGEPFAEATKQFYGKRKAEF